MVDEIDANKRWAEMLSEWAIPGRVVKSAPASPYFFDPQVFIDAADEAISRREDTPSDAAARAALAPGGTVLDVACGAGAASLRLAPATLFGVDPSSALLEAFSARATALQIASRTIEASWPEAAPQTPVADVAVCHHVVYNVPNLAAFASALRDHAVRRVVVELTAVHPMAWMAPYWEAMHGLSQPDRPVADDAIAVLNELGFDVHQQRWPRHYQMIGETGDESLLRIARRLCVPPARHEELAKLLAAIPPPREREMVTLWW
jgi:SAM-dependent methyltransferase